MHHFCPNRTGIAQVSTCESRFDTKLYVNGTDVDRECDDDCGLGTCRRGLGFGNNEFLTFDFKAGECYDVIVGGFANSEGEYVLSIDCVDQKVLECGRNSTGSTVGLPSLSPQTVAGVQPFIFCPGTSGRASVSTCGSNFSAGVGSGPVVFTNATQQGFDCSAECNAACVRFNFRHGGSMGDIGLGFSCIFLGSDTVVFANVS